jgi:ribosome-binding factor A
VYVSVLGDHDEREASLEGLRSAHGYLQRRIGSELHLKRTPALTFAYDDTAERAMHLEALIESELDGEDDRTAEDDHTDPQRRAGA